MLLAAVGKTRPQIAEALGLSQPTLRKHYFSRESRYQLKLADAPVRVTAKILLRLYEQAEAGNVSAIRLLWHRLDRAEERERANALASPAPQPRLGKKEAQSLAAREVGGIYAPPPAPGLAH
ncbi:MAG: hypothetical protein K2Q06_07895 [Parvularculaceae bacterium]|nr:hypothetical protein [Parvularculaceae bacterium]